MFVQQASAPSQINVPQHFGKLKRRVKVEKASYAPLDLSKFRIISLTTLQEEEIHILLFQICSARYDSLILQSYI